MNDFKQHALEGGGGAGGRGVGPGGGDLGEFTFGKRWGFSSNLFRCLVTRCAHGPLLSLNGSVAGSPVGLAPPNRPLSLGGLMRNGCGNSLRQKVSKPRRILRQNRVNTNALRVTWCQNFGFYENPQNEAKMNSRRGPGGLLADLGRPVALLEPFWCPPGALLAALGRLLGRSWRLLGPTWGRLGASWAALGTS